MDILGLSCFYHDSAACLIRNGEIIAAVQEERFTRRKHDCIFPLNSIQYCLKEANIDIEDLDYTGFYDNSFAKRLRIPYLLNKLGYKKKILIFNQDDSYLASAYYPSGLSNSAILVNGITRLGVLFGRGQGNRIESFYKHGFYGSLGSIYSAVTYYLGFRPHSDEYKVIGLAAYGKPKYRDLILKNKEKLKCGNFKKTNRILKNLFDCGPRQENLEISQKHMDIASSVQAAIEEETFKITYYLHRLTGSGNLCIAGDLALNCLLNTKILKQGIFKNLWIQPASTDAGCAIGVAFLIWHRYLSKNLLDTKEDLMKSAFLGPSYSDNDIEKFLRQQNIIYKKLDYSNVPGFTAELVAKGKVVGWFQGRLEFGPRALGARSILADSRDMKIHDRINLRVKFREPFRPLAPVILAEKTGEYFDLDKENPYMLLVAGVKEDKRKEIPAVIHIDNSSRVQTIKRDKHPLYYDTIYEFYKKTGCPVIINTSFNTKDEPIVLSPQDAYVCFQKSDIDYLIMGSFLLDKREQKKL